MSKGQVVTARALRSNIAHSGVAQALAGNRPGTLTTFRLARVLPWDSNW